MGIGRVGSLPWPALKSEMGYFARVTKRPPPPPCTNQASTQPNKTTTTTTTNAVIMGRKTWESIPRKFRPLRDRINVVVSRRGNGSLDVPADVIVAPSLEDGVMDLVRTYGGGGGGDGGGEEEKQQLLLLLGRVFVIGGAEIYRAAMGLPGNVVEGGGKDKDSTFPVVDRILWTKIKSDFECDTFFPVDLQSLADGKMGWLRRDKGELDRWTGEVGLGEVRREDGVEYQICLLEKGVNPGI